MDFENIADHFRRFEEPLAVSQIIIITDKGDFCENGKLRRNENNIELEVILDGDQGLPEMGGTIKRDQFWRIGGVIEEQVPFWGVSVPHQHSFQDGRFTVRSGSFSFDRIHHLTLPFEDGRIRDAMVEASKGPREEPGRFVNGYMKASLTDFKIVSRWGMTVTVEQNPFIGDTRKTERNTLVGTVGDFEYGFIQRDKDCDIHLRLKNGSMAPMGQIKRVSQALYRALAFVHGRSCWPQYESIHDGKGNDLEYATAPRRVSDNIHTPLTERTCSHGSDAAQLISKAIECFLRDDDFSKALEHFLYLTREAAAKDTPIYVRTLGLCAVFEGFVAFLFDHFCTKDETASSEQFEQARSSLVEYARQHTEPGDGLSETVGAWERFLGLLQSARSMRPADKYNRLVKHMQLPPQKMSLALEAWKRHRHPLAHGSSQKGDLMEQMFATSRIAGAINVLAASALNYSGAMVLSRIDDQFISLNH